MTNAFALLGLRAHYFVLHDALNRLMHLNFGLAAILGFIGAKLTLHWAHTLWPSVPEISTLASLAHNRGHPGPDHPDQPAGHPAPGKACRQAPGGSLSPARLPDVVAR